LNDQPTESIYKEKKNSSSNQTTRKETGSVFKKRHWRLKLTDNGHDLKVIKPRPSGGAGRKLFTKNSGECKGEKIASDKKDSLGKGQKIILIEEKETPRIRGNPATVQEEKRFLHYQNLTKWKGQIWGGGGTTNLACSGPGPTIKEKQKCNLMGGPSRKVKTVATKLLTGAESVVCNR